MSVATKPFQPITVPHQPISVQVGGPPRPEIDHEGLRRADRCTTREAASEFFVSQAAFESACAGAGFPRPLGYKFDQRGGRAPVWSRRQIAQWRDGVRRLAATFK
jgi:hypothetical protein